MNQPMNPNTTAETEAHRDVDAHAPAAGVTEEIGGYVFTIKPLKVKQVFPFLKLARPLFAALVKKPSSPPSGLPPTDAGSGQGGDPTAAPARPTAAPIDVEAVLGSAEWFLDVLTEHGPTVIEALAVALEPDQSKDAQDAMNERLGELDLVDLVVLLKHFITVNVDFFATRGVRLPPSLPGMVSAAATNAGVGRKAAPRRKR